MAVMYVGLIDYRQAHFPQRGSDLGHIRGWVAAHARARNAEPGTTEPGQGMRFWIH
jgi:hypothetical protein